MLKRVLGLLGWLGVVLVLSAFVIWLTRPEWEQWRFRLAMAGLACTLLYILSQWREIQRSFSGRPGTKNGPAHGAPTSSCPSVRFPAFPARRTDRRPARPFRTLTG